MAGNSRSVSSPQEEIHDNLERTVLRHLQHPWQKPYAQHSLQVFAELCELVQAHSGPIVLDSCCGVGESSRELAVMHPNALVIGLDKSAHRIDKHERAYQDQSLGNYVVRRADLNDLWRLIAKADWPISHHYILYPNPWPKKHHLQRRWHGGAAFSALLEIPGRLELRSNWKLYLEEFAFALKLAQYDSQLCAYQCEHAITPFERKYWQSGQASWQLITQIVSSDPTKD
ncbi:tRNA (guanine(46)-N(7))-methyltransferase TrmB [Alginatibacterium sediminis]|nr:methyltransferase domain-containing protein [Alginatibacterium sediminis]